MWQSKEFSTCEHIRSFCHVWHRLINEHSIVHNLRRWSCACSLLPYWWFFPEGERSQGGIRECTRYEITIDCTHVLCCIDMTVPMGHIPLVATYSGLINSAVCGGLCLYVGVMCLFTLVRNHVFICASLWMCLNFNDSRKWKICWFLDLMLNAKSSVLAFYVCECHCLLHFLEG